MAVWLYGLVALWLYGRMALWPCGLVALWPCGLVALWALWALWPCGLMGYGGWWPEIAVALLAGRLTVPRPAATQHTQHTQRRAVQPRLINRAA